VQAANAERIDAIMEGVKKIDATGKEKDALSRFAYHRLQELSQ
jgi:hypothetical protein